MKYIILDYGFEYNDEGYDPNGYLAQDTRSCKSLKEAESKRLEMMIDRIKNDDFDLGFLDCVDWDTRQTVMQMVNADEDDWGFKFNPKGVKDPDIKKIANITASSFYDIQEVDDKEEFEIINEDKYYRNEFHFKTDDDNVIILHNLNGPAKVKYWDKDYPDEKDEEFWIEGQQISEEDMFKMKARKEKIETVLDSDKS